ncbi:MAG: Holliday junction resolvase RuvX [Bacteroidales bacterium]
MSRIVAIDYGLKRVGLAVTDENRIIATALTTVQTRDIFNFLGQYLKNEHVGCIVVGDPKQMNNQASETVNYIEPFIRKLKKMFPGLLVERYDERFTSKIAIRAMVEGGMKKKERKNKENIDKISAVLILQSYMEFTGQ